MSKYTLRIEATYDMTGDLLTEYREWLDDYRDTPEMRNEFLLDRFISPTALKQVDPQARYAIIQETVSNKVNNWLDKTEANIQASPESTSFQHGMLFAIERIRPIATDPNGILVRNLTKRDA